MIRAPKTALLIPLLFLSLLLCHCPIIHAQLKSPLVPIDSLIVQIPAMMRSNENKAREMIATLATQSLQQQNRHGLIQSVFYQAWLSYRHDPADVALERIDSALLHIQGINQDTAYAKFYILKGQCYVKKTQYEQALDNFKLALKIANDRNDQTTKISTLISIGWAYMEDNKPGEAIQYFQEVLQHHPSEHYENRALLLCNIASCYNALGNFELAATYAQKGTSAARSKQNNMDLANGLNILARSYYRLGKRVQAISFLKEAAVARKKVADPSMLASDYLELAELYGKNHQPDRAIVWAHKAEVLSLQNANRLKLADAYRSLADAYETMGAHKQAAQYLNKLLLQKDSLAADQYNKAFAQMQVQFETQKKIAENLQLRKENLESTLKVSYQQRWLFILVMGLVLIPASLVYYSKLMKSRFAIRLAQEQLHQQKERSRAAMEAEENERRRIAADLHDGVGQLLAAASMQLHKAVNNNLSFIKVEELIHQAGTEVRNLSHQVTPELLLHHGLVHALEQAVDRLNDTNAKPIFTLFTHIEAPLADTMISLTLYRCFQELCTNILKHAHACQVAVHLNLQPEELQLLMEDDGIGYQPGKDAYGLGLKNIENRLSLYNGALQIDSTPGRGTTTIIKIGRPVEV